MSELIEAVGGKLLREEGGAAAGLPCEETDSAPRMDVKIRSVVTDSRNVEEKCVFFALSGERFDGHAYVASALEKGAAGCVISKVPEEGARVPGKFYVLVRDTRRALGDLARYYREKFDVKVVGITGSVGKTTCREMVQAVLSRRFRVHATKGNFNNEIGLPLTIFGLSKDDQVLVVEMGMNHPGEIRYLSRIAEPDLAVITNIGTAHIGLLGSREAIFQAKREIFDGLKDGGAAILCGDDDFLPRIREEVSLSGRYRLFYAGKGPDCDYRVKNIRVEIGTAGKEKGRAEFSTLCEIRMPRKARGDAAESRETVGAEPREIDARISAIGMHLVYPASIAAAVGDLLGMTAAEIRDGIADFKGQRMPCEEYGDFYLFDDTYNASPDSMKSSMEALACVEQAVPGIIKAAVLGDMFEQGAFADSLHREVGRAAAETGIDILITVGPLSAAMAEEAREAGVPDVRAFGNLEDAAQAVEEITRPGTAVLFKASNAMHLGRLAALSRKKAGGERDGI
ncbi:MAG: UDP-N-acetylmuramoyl-tripeptide--D-alanyl-D-alanine ligase [Eubacteriales bacterium]|nr:UDP-N-acetylmuramoyl-tripeptide--D-alanyl-D-alanine ligase [Eubacteriales bacterium]